ncbi:type II secretory pathway protein [Aestuariibacter sp. AA17]|uniref:Type II secretory pathway protein n=1 Tax=Fluctibacter corallii TaxID=2984329 RepID=A0ABT3AAW7_9ALTE|nr:type II secretory pathway protein [Aestuariibacter sp. AA17]MCV2885778.1 type II secretory pathway protein [Aestuariibacter sp. AA17]
MYLNAHSNNSVKDIRSLSGLAAQRGSLLVVAVFVVVVFSLIGLVMTRMLAASAQNTVVEVYGLRALNAAQSALQQKVALAFPVTGASTCDDSLALDLSAQNGFEGCSATATCALTPFTSENIDYYRFEATGVCVAGEIVTSRRVKIDAKVNP